jgi:hypothetical protein
MYVRVHLARLWAAASFAFSHHCNARFRVFGRIRLRPTGRDQMAMVDQPIAELQAYTHLHEHDPAHRMPCNRLLVERVPYKCPATAGDRKLRDRPGARGAGAG